MAVGEWRNDGGGGDRGDCGNRRQRAESESIDEAQQRTVVSLQQIEDSPHQAMVRNQEEEERNGGGGGTLPTGPSLKHRKTITGQELRTAIIRLVPFPAAAMGTAS